MSAYTDLLRHPKWQRRRLEIMSRDGFACTCCHADDKTLNVHHKRYRPGAAPWEYSDDELVTLCEDCHESEHELPPVIDDGAWRKRIRDARFARMHPVERARLELVVMEIVGGLPQDYA